MLDKMFTEAELVSLKENGSGDIKPDFSLNYRFPFHEVLSEACT